MFYVLLFAAAFFFILADRKIRTSQIAAFCVTLTACLVLTGRIVANGNRIKVIGTGGSRITGVFLTITICIFLTSLIFLLLYLLGSLLGKAIMPYSKDGLANKITSTVFFIVGTFITLISGLNLMFMSRILKLGPRIIPIESLRKDAVKIRYLIHEFAVPLQTLQYLLLLFGSILFLIFILCGVRIAVRKGLFKDLNGIVKPDKKDLKRSKALLIGEILSGIGFAGTLIISLICIFTSKQSGRIYFFDGYTHTKILSGLALLLMLTGTVFLIIGLVILSEKRQMKLQKLSIHIASVLIALSCSSSILMILNAMRWLFKIR